jgi:hypothetical protein
MDNTSVYYDATSGFAINVLVVHYIGSCYKQTVSRGEQLLTAILTFLDEVSRTMPPIRRPYPPDVATLDFSDFTSSPPFPDLCSMLCA